MSKRPRFINGKTIFSAVIVVLLIVVVAVLVVMNNNPIYNDDYFKSDDKKIVLLVDRGEFEEEDTPIKTYMIYYYSGEKIDAVKQFYQFKSNEISSRVKETINADEMEWVKEITVSGPYIIFNLAESEFEGLTTTMIRESVENLNSLEDE